MAETPKTPMLVRVIQFFLLFVVLITLLENVGCYYRVDGTLHHWQLGSGVGLW